MYRSQEILQIFYKKNLSKVEKILKNNDIFYENIGITQKTFFEGWEKNKIIYL